MREIFNFSPVAGGYFVTDNFIEMVHGLLSFTGSNKIQFFSSLHHHLPAELAVRIFK